MPPVHPDIHVNPSPSYVLGVGQGTEYQDMALGYERQGDFARAEAMYLQAIQIKETHLGLNHPSLAITLNSLGELYYRNLNRPDDAERVLSRALQIRREIEPAFDAAVTRENLGAVYEMKGNLEAAREMRQRGRPHQVACGNYDCTGSMYSYTKRELAKCSQCKCVFYCCKTCQAADWKARHKNYCKPMP